MTVSPTTTTTTITTAIDAKVAAMEVKVNNHEQRLDAHGKEIDALRLSVEHYHAATDEKLDRLNETTQRIDRRLETELQRPADKWRSFTAQVFSYIVAIVLALIIARLGLAV